MALQFKKALVLLGVMFTFSISANKPSVRTGEPRAVISYNADKSGTTTIEYNTSFFIFDLSMDDAGKNVVIKEIMTADPSFKKLELQPVNGVKDMMVILDVSAKNLKDLTKKMRNLLLKLKVRQVDYKGAIVSTETFSF